MQYSIGQFSMMMDVGKKTLRYYDEIDLFKPEYVNEANQYRFYGETQISALKKIIKLREVGIPLEDIKRTKGSDDANEMSRLFLERLRDIDVTIQKLQAQKKLIQSYVDNASKEKDSKPDFEITEGFHITEGYVYYNENDISIEDIHQAINDFYHNLNGFKLLSGHIFKRNLQEEMPEISEIFAYVDAKEEDPSIRVQKKLKSVKLKCRAMAEKLNAYQQLFAYINKKGYSLSDVYEKYNMGDAGMQIDIIAAIE
ncbi:MAG: MerR family transcriptional regulator [Eubacteriales bacterium]